MSGLRSVNGSITAEEIAKYAELTSLLTQLEKQKEQLRAELLELHDDGAQQEETGPYLLAFTDQEREIEGQMGTVIG